MLEIILFGRADLSCGNVAQVFLKIIRVYILQDSADHLHSALNLFRNELGEFDSNINDDSGP